MDTVKKMSTFFRKPFWSDYKTLFGLWVFLALIAWLTKYFPDSYNNFKIFRGVFWHAIEQLPLYAEYPQEYFDTNHYGPFFSLVIAPFAITPVWLGLLTWLVVLAVFLYVATRTLPVRKGFRVFIYWFCAHELLSALFMSQFNIAIAAMVILSFTLIEKEKDFWAALMIVAGTFVKLYGIVGLAFFFFSKHKVKFILSCLFWSVVMFVAPMLVTGPEYVIGQYGEWYQSLTDKNSENLFAVYQNISFLGMVRKISGSVSYSDRYLVVGGLILLALPYLRIDQYKHQGFRLTLLASVLLFVVLFSTGSETSSYIIAFMGVAIWYMAAPWKRGKWDIFLLVFAFLLTSMSSSDLFPKPLRVHVIRPYALKALPCIIIWLKLIYEMLTRKYDEKDTSLKG